MQSLEVKHFFDPVTSTLTYVVCDPRTRDAVIIDPVLDYKLGDNVTEGTTPGGVVATVGDVRTENTSDKSFKEVAEFVAKLQLNIRFILETHAHADHLSAAQIAKKLFPQALLGIGERIREVQATFAKDFNLSTIDGSQFDRLFVAGEEVEAGSLRFKIMPLPGHTPACVGYLFTEPNDESKILFSGDAIFMPDSGTGRCDFPGGSAEALYVSISEGIYRLADDTKIYVGHDYQPEGRPLKFQTTVDEEQTKNIHIKKATTKAEFVKFRTERDRTLKEPRLMIPSLKVNLVAGRTRR